MNLHNSWKLIAVLSLLLGIGAASSLVAQSTTTAAPSNASGGSATPTDTNQPATVLEKVVVTGSNILSATDALSVPVTFLGTPEIQNSGDVTSTLDILRKVAPSISGIGAENASIGTSQTYGGAEIFIHGLPALILVNGHRVSTSSSEALGSDSFVDLNMIPPGAIDHMEILQDGASAIYGSDAQGGVINIILKQNFNGWELDSHYGFSPNVGHYSERTFSLVGGVSDSKTSITLSADYTSNPMVMFSQRPNTASYYQSPNYAGIVDVYSSSGGTAANLYQADNFYMLNPKYNSPPTSGNYTMPQLVSLGYYIPLGDYLANPTTTLAAAESGLNLAYHESLLESLKRSSTTINIDHKIFGEQLEAFGDVIYSKTVTQSSLNANPIFPYLSDPTNDLWNVGVTPPPPALQSVLFSAIKDNPFSQVWSDDGVTDGSAGNTVTVHNRFTQYPRIYENNSNLLDVVGGLKGQINDNYSWEGSITISRDDLDYQNQNVVDTKNLNAAVANGTINLFAINQAPGALPGNIIGTAFADGTSDLSVANFIFRGLPLDLPAGKLAFAVGTQYSREVLNATADLNSQTGNWADAPTIRPIDIQRKVASIYGEVEIPIAGKGYNTPGIYLLNADVAYRSDDYYGTGTSDTPKVSLKYEPINDDFAFRASASKSFTAPPLYDLYGPINTGSSQSISYNTYGGGFVPIVQFQDYSGSNPNLKPATSTTWTTGLIYTPKKALNGLSVSVDYFETVVHNQPGTINEQTMVQSVEDLGSKSPYAQYVHFGSYLGPTATAPGQISGHPAASVWLVSNEMNLGATAIKAWDAQVDYQFKVASLGKFDAGTNVTFYDSYLFQQVPFENYYQYAGTASSNLNGTIPRFRFYTTLNWQNNGWEAELNNTAIPTVRDVGSGGSEASKPAHVSSYLQWDASLAYHLSELKVSHWLDGLTVRVGIDNAFNRQPPLASNAFSEAYADLGTYNGNVGRMWFVDATYKF
jgi:iron complex outermembrane receptor protein